VRRRINTFKLVAARCRTNTLDACAPDLFEERFEILKHFVFFLGLRAISEKELLAQV
jgi:hypothetical protein